MIQKQNIILTDEQLNFLAEAYIKLRNNKTYQKMTSTFRNFIDEFLEKELLSIQRHKRGIR